MTAVTNESQLRLQGQLNLLETLAKQELLTSKIFDIVQKNISGFSSSSDGASDAIKDGLQGRLDPLQAKIKNPPLFSMSTKLTILAAAILVGALRQNDCPCFTWNYWSGSTIPNKVPVA